MAPRQGFIDAVRLSVGVSVSDTPPPPKKKRWSISVLTGIVYWRIYSLCLP